MSNSPRIFITLQDAKDQLSIDEGLTIHDRRIQLLINAAVSWAENYTQRSIGQLMELDSPPADEGVPLPNPVDSPAKDGVFVEPGDRPFVIGGLPGIPGSGNWTDEQWRDHWKNQNPIMQDDSDAKRSDIKSAILLKIEQLFDRNTETWQLLEDTALQMLTPYRIGMGV
jgi:hypothetical protein